MSSTIELIVARSQNGVIGKEGVMPWHIPEDLKHFKAVTMGSPVIMGRKTWQAIGRALPGRQNIVITRQKNFIAPGAQIAPNLLAAFELAASASRIFIIGGAELYRSTLPLVDVAWITQIETVIDGDAFFEALPTEDWNEETLSELPATPERPAVRFLRLTRKKPAQHPLKTDF